MPRPAFAAVLALTLLLAPLSTSAGMYGGKVVTLTSSNFEASVIASPSTWLVKFYAPWCGHCKSSAPAFTTASKKLDGVAKVGVVNCDDEKDVCSKYGVKGFPSIKVFKGFGKAARTPEDYNGDRGAKALITHAKYVTPSDIARVKESGLDAFYRDERTLPHVLLFTDKAKTSPLYKGLSAEFRGRAAFGEVRKGDAGDLLSKFGVSSFPALVAFKAGETEAEKALKHAGGMDPKSLRAFFAQITDGVEAVPEDGEPRKRDPKEKVFKQPEAFVAGVVDVKSGKEYEDKCGARKDGRMCGLAFLPGGTAHAVAGELKAVAEKFQYDNLAFAVVDSEGEDGGGKALKEAFGIVSGEGFLVMRARKKKFSLMEGGVSGNGISGFLDKLVGGDGRFKKLKDDLPAWAGPPVEEQKGEAGGEAEKEDGEPDGGSGQCGTDPPKDGEQCGA